MKNQLTFNWKTFLLMGTVLLAGILIGKFLDTEASSPISQNKEIRQGGYKFISPLLECEMSPPSSFRPIEKKIKERLNEEVFKKNSDVHVSLYFRNLNNGPSLGMNENDNFSPASLLKVPLMMAYFRLAEKDPHLLEKKVVFIPANLEYKQENQKEKRLEIGKEYTIRELINNMIIYSDNNALNTLFQNINLEELKLIYSDLGVPMPDIYDPNNYMTVKEYASFFRILYNASYLDKNYSEEALKILSQVDFKEGIVSGVKENVKVSHKFGERESMEKGKVVRQLHDCGIVYASSYPYLLCIMTKGEDFKTLLEVIRETSKIFHEEVIKN